MPWKIKKSSNLTDKTDPRIHMFDGSVNVNMVTHLDSGVVDLWVGSNEPDLAGVYLTIDVERNPIVRVEPTAGSPRGLDLAVITTVLESLGQNPQPLLGHFYRNSRRAFRDHMAESRASSRTDPAKPRP